MAITTYTGYIVEFISTSHDCKTPTLFGSLGDAMANVHNVMAKQFNVTDFHVSEDELKPGRKWHCYFEGDRTPVKATQSAFNGQAKVDFPDAFATAKSGNRVARTPDTGATGAVVAISNGEKIQHGITANEAVTDFLLGKTTPKGNAPKLETLTPEQYELVQSALNLADAVRKSLSLKPDMSFREMVVNNRKNFKEQLPETK